MKYLITENRLNEFMTNYLNSWIESKAVSHSSPFIIVQGQIDQYSEEWEDFMEYDSSDGRLWINKHFKKHLMDLFNKNEVDVRVFVGKWFENKFNVDIKFVE
jgi:hypothetical protein